MRRTGAPRAGLESVQRVAPTAVRPLTEAGCCYQIGSKNRFPDAWPVDPPDVPSGGGAGAVVMAVHTATTGLTKSTPPPTASIALSLSGRMAVRVVVCLVAVMAISLIL